MTNTADTKRIFISLDEIAELLEVTPRRINQLVKTDAFPRATKGKYDLVDAFRWLKRKVDATDNGDETERAAKLRLIQNQAELRELEIMQRRGELIPKSVVIPEMNKIHHAVKTKLMAIGNDISLELSQIDEPPKVKSIIDGAVRDALDELDQTGARMANAAQTKYTVMDDAELPGDVPPVMEKKPKRKRK